MWDGMRFAWLERRMKLSILSLSLLLATSACASSTAEGGATTDSDFTGAKAGFNDVSREWGMDKASGIAVRDGNAYVGFGERGYAVLDLRTMKTTRRVLKDAANRLVAADSVAMVGDDLMVAGLRNDAPNDPYRGGSYLVFVVSLLDRTTGALKKEIAVDVMKVISNGADPLLDRPNIAVTIEGRDVWLAFSHPHAKKLVRFELPAARTTTLDLKTLLEGETLAIDSAKDVAIHDGAAYLPATTSDGRGGYVRRVQLPGGATTKVGANLGYPVGIAFAGRALLVANHQQSLFVLDAQTGATLQEVAIPDWITGVTSDQDNVYVSTWKGVFVVKNTWR